MTPPIPVDARRQDWPRLVATRVNKNTNDVGSLEERVAALESLSTGLGWVDYSDASAGTAAALTVGSYVQMTRTLSASATNNRLRGPFAGHAFWDNTAHVARPRALYDVIYLSIYLRVNPGASNGAIDVQLLAGTIDVGTKTFPLTGATGSDQGLRADFIVPVRTSFVANGAKVMVRTNVNADLKEFSPEFYPLSYEP